MTITPASPGPLSLSVHSNWRKIIVFVYVAPLTSTDGKMNAKIKGTVSALTKILKQDTFHFQFKTKVLCFALIVRV